MDLKCIHELKVLILYSVDTTYMLTAVTVIKMFFANLINFTCLAHRLHHTAKEPVNFYGEYSEIIKSFAAKFPFGSPTSVHQAQSAFSNPKVVCSIAYIQSNGSWLQEI